MTQQTAGPLGRNTDETTPPARPSSPPVTPAGAPAGHPAVTARPFRARLGPLWRRLRTVLLPLLGALALVGAVLVYDAQRPAAYSSEALVAVLPDDPGGDVSLQITSIWVEIANSDVVMDRVAAALDVSPGVLSEGLTVAESADAPLISIRALAGDPVRAAQWADVAAQELLRQADTNAVPGFYLQQVADAQPAQSPDASTTLLLLAGAAVFGLLLGAAAAQLLAGRDRRRSARTAAPA